MLRLLSAFNVITRPVSFIQIKELTFSPDHNVLIKKAIEGKIKRSAKDDYVHKNAIPFLSFNDLNSELS